MVMPRPTALRLASGAITATSPCSESARLADISPSDWMPSSFVSRIFTRRRGAYPRTARLPSAPCQALLQPPARSRPLVAQDRVVDGVAHDAARQHHVPAKNTFVDGAQPLDRPLRALVAAIGLERHPPRAELLEGMP